MNEKKGELAGRVAFVTGGNRGIGRAIAETMADAGASVAICGLDKSELDSTLASLKNRGVKCEAYATDATRPDQISSAIASIKKDFGSLDILVNNIGAVKQFSNFEGLTDENWQEVFDINLMSMVRFSRAAFPLLCESKHGRVINIASVAGKRPGNFNPHYGAMKAAMIHLSKYLSNQWAQYKILVNTICPHTVKGGVWENNVENKAKMDRTSFEEAEKNLLQEVTSKTPLKDICLPSDVAELTVFLASDKARFMTGVCLTLDGGTVNSIF